MAVNYILYILIPFFKRLLIVIAESAKSDVSKYRVESKQVTQLRSRTFYPELLQ